MTDYVVQMGSKSTSIWEGNISLHNPVCGTLAILGILNNSGVVLQSTEMTLLEVGILGNQVLHTLLIDVPCM